MLAAHAWAHQPLGRLGNLIDVAVSLRRSDAAEVAAGAPLGLHADVAHHARRGPRGGRGRAAARPASRCGRGTSAEVRERTVFEWHLKDLLAPVWGLSAPHAIAPGAVLRATGRAGRRAVAREAGRARLRRNAGLARSEHDLG